MNDKKTQDNIIKYCPTCKIEYEAWAEKCADCGSDLIEYFLCPGCHEGTRPLEEKMDLPCPICAYVPSLGHQDPSTLTNLLKSKMTEVDKEVDSNFLMNLCYRSSLNELISEPWFRALVPSRERLLIKVRIYGISIFVLIILIFISILISKGTKLAFWATAFILAIFFSLRNRLLMSAFSKAFDKHYQELLSNKSNASS